MNSSESAAVNTCPTPKKPRTVRTEQQQPQQQLLRGLIIAVRRPVFCTATGATIEHEFCGSPYTDSLFGNRAVDVRALHLSRR